MYIGTLTFVNYDIKIYFKSYKMIKKFYNSEYYFFNKHTAKIVFSRRKVLIYYTSFRSYFKLLIK